LNFRRLIGIKKELFLDEDAFVFVSENCQVVGIATAPNAEFPSVNIDNFEISLSLTQHVIDSGHRHFVYLKGFTHSHVANERYRGFRAALAENNLRFNEEFAEVASFLEDQARAVMHRRFAVTVQAKPCGEGG
jgi:DNA-binding LacI/PurR family transcriptional regulator